MQSFKLAVLFKSRTKSKTEENFLLFFLFLTFSFPKAGVTISGVPITLQMVLIPIILVLLLKEIPAAFSKCKLLLSFYIFYSFLILFSCLINLFDFTETFYFYLRSLILLISPLFITAGAMAAISKENFGKVILISGLIVTTYSIIQKIWGITATSIPGITYTYGSSLVEKPIGYNSSTDTALKMPSTYQNGNSSGLFLLLVLCYSIYVLTIVKRPHVFVLFLALSIYFSIGILLAGSRSAIFGLILSLIFIAIYQSFSKLNLPKIKFKKRIFGTIAFASLLILLIIVLSNSNVINTFITRTLNDPTGNGRTQQIEYLLNEFGKYPLSFIFGLRWNIGYVGEGFYSLWACYGLLFFLTFFGFLLYCSFSRKNSSIFFSIALFAICIAFFVDSSFYYLPNLINFFIFFGYSISGGNKYLIEIK